MTKSQQRCVNCTSAAIGCDLNCPYNLQPEDARREKFAKAKNDMPRHSKKKKMIIVVNTANMPKKKVIRDSDTDHKSGVKPDYLNRQKPMYSSMDIPSRRINRYC